MITDPFAVFAVLICIEALILLLKKPLARLYYYIPPLVWMYFVPMILTTMGVLPGTSIVYDYLNSYALPAALLLIMLSSSIKGITRIGPQSILAMLVGSLGIILGSILGYVIFKQYLPSDMWGALASLSASWMGGSANMMAVFESFNAPPEYLSPVIIVDTVIAYVWLALLIYLAKYQRSIDSRNGVSSELMSFLYGRAENVKEERGKQITIKSLIALAFIAVIFVYLTTKISKYMPTFEGISSFVWVIVIITAIGIALSFTRARELGGGSTAGYLLLYLFLVSVGAKSNLADIGATPAVFGWGMVTLAVHIVLLLLLIKLMKLPMFLFASASMANIGGTASASVVAGVYNGSLIPIAVIISVFGYVIGTYGGLLVGIVCSAL
jgi:uncharacterized membrane protein